MPFIEDTHDTHRYKQTLIYRKGQNNTLLIYLRPFYQVRIKKEISPPEEGIPPSSGERMTLPHPNLGLPGSLETISIV